MSKIYRPYNMLLLDQNLTYLNLVSTSIKFLLYKDNGFDIKISYELIKNQNLIFITCFNGNEQTKVLILNMILKIMQFRKIINTFEKELSK